MVTTAFRDSLPAGSQALSFFDMVQVVIYLQDTVEVPTIPSMPLVSKVFESYEGGSEHPRKLLTRRQPWKEACHRKVRHVTLHQIIASRRALQPGQQQYRPSRLQHTWRYDNKGPLLAIGL